MVILKLPVILPHAHGEISPQVRERDRKREIEKERWKNRDRKREM